MNILITGANGFIGSNLLHLIKSESLFTNDRIILLASCKMNGYECILHNNYTFTKDNFLKEGINEIDIVFHLGAATPQIPSEYGWEYTNKFIKNIHNTIHLIENLPNIPEKFIFTSSVDIYKKTGKIIDEESPLPNDNSYSLSKFICEKYMETKAKELGFVLQILRLGQIYGPGEERYSKIVSGFMRLIFDNQIINVFGDGTNSRSMLHVDDCCRCITQSVSFEKYIEPVNIVSSQSITIKNLIDLMYVVCSEKQNVKYGSSKNTDSNVYDNTKMKKYFNISETPLKEGIEKYYEYYKSKNE